MKKTIKDYDLSSKKVIIRCDLNVPMQDGKITDETRIKASLKTINYALDHKAKVIILSHLGKIKTEEDKENNSLYPVSVRLSELLGQKVIFSKETHGPELETKVANLKDGDVLLVENTRFEDLDNKKESSCDPELSKYWANLGDIFINDAYGTCHRAHASNVGVAKLLPNGIGFLVEEEINKLDEIINEDTHPYIVVMGGKKVSDKIKLIENIIPKCDKLIIGGAMAYTFLKALGNNIGGSIYEEDSLSYCKNLVAKYPNKIILPVDTKVSTSLDSSTYTVKEVGTFDDNDIGFDIGTKTIKKFQDCLEGAKRVIINGPMGVFERPLYQEGTKAIYSYLTTHNIKTLIGGGDSAASVKQLGFDGKFYHISTGGGATLEYLEGKDLPGISVINNEE